MMAECEPIYSACIKPASLPDKEIAEARQLSSEFYETAAKAEREQFENNKIKAEKGDPEAQYRLGYCYKYADIQGVPKDTVEAVKWFRKAAQQNHAHAEYSLGCCYEHGTGVPEDFVEACKWFNLALAHGYKNAMPNLAFLAYMLGCRYRDGDGVPKNSVEAYKWFDVAIPGSDDAITHRDALIPLMTSDQIAEGQKLSSEFKPQNKSASGNSSSP
jgi:TPR repeat protein